MIVHIRYAFTFPDTHRTSSILDLGRNRTMPSFDDMQFIPWSAKMHFSLLFDRQLVLFISATRPGGKRIAACFKNEMGFVLSVSSLSHSLYLSFSYAFCLLLYLQWSVFHSNYFSLNLSVDLYPFLSAQAIILHANVSHGLSFSFWITFCVCAFYQTQTTYTFSIKVGPVHTTYPRLGVVNTYVFIHLLDRS